MNRRSKVVIETDQTQPNGERDSIPSQEAEILGQEFSDILNTRPFNPSWKVLPGLDRMAITIMDLKGKILAASGWQVICTQFHRATPQTAKNCTESDSFLPNMPAWENTWPINGKNNLWEIVTPLYVEDKHIANIYSGHFFYDTDVVDDEVFVNQAKQYGFDPEK